MYPTSAQDQQLNENGNSLYIAPNPVSSNFTLKYNLAQLGPVEFTLYDGRGKLVSKQMKESTPSYLGELNWNIDQKLASGECYISMQQKGKKVATCKLIKTK